MEIVRVDINVIVELNAGASLSLKDKKNSNSKKVNEGQSGVKDFVYKLFCLLFVLR